MTRLRLACLLWSLALSCTAHVPDARADSQIDHPRMRLVIDAAGQWRSVIDKASGRELVPGNLALPIAEVHHGRRRCAAVAAVADGGRLIVAFADTDTAATYAVEQNADWIVLRLLSVTGTRPSGLTLVQIPVSISQNVGPRLNAAWDERTVVCAMAATNQVDCLGRAGPPAVLSAVTQDAPGPRIENAAVAILVCPTPEFKALARALSHAYGLPANEDEQGVPVKDTDLVRGSYWFLSCGEDDVDRVIEYCQQSGIRQVMLAFDSWCISAGHYVFNLGRYPHGQAGLKAVVEKLHAHNILVGMHTFVSKISKRDPYVTPVPDPRLLRGISASWQPSDGLLETTVREPVTAEQTAIRVAGRLQFWPGSSAVADRAWEGGVDKHREVIVGGEIVRYARIGPEGVWDTFEDCERGAYGTAAAAHAAGASAYHVCVDGCINGYVIDQETTLLAEVAERLAAIFNECGFDMVYFDGGEDVDRRRFSYYVANFQQQAMQRFAQRPVIHMGTIMNHWLWHSFARSSTVDHYLNTLSGAIVAGQPPTQWPSVKDHVDRSVQYMLSVRQDMMPGELGWFGVWPPGTRTYTVTVSDADAQRYRALGGAQRPVALPSRENTVITGQMISPSELRVDVAYDGLQLDEIEYLMCKSLGYDVPISLQTGFAQLEAHGLSPEILAIVRGYEAMRMGGLVSDEVRARLRAPGKDFARVRVDGQDSWAEVERIDKPAGERDVRAMVGTWGTGSVATVWHTQRDGQLIVDVDPGSVRLVSFAGDLLPVATEEGRTLVPVNGTRTTLVCPHLAPAQLRAALNGAAVRLRAPARRWICAADFNRVVGQMARGSDAGVRDPDAFGDVLVATGQPAANPAREWFAEYTVEIPRAGLWTIWGRVRYPRGGDDSFGFVVPGEPVDLTLGAGQILGNCGVQADRWHWTGSGSGSATVPPGQPLTRKLAAGPFTFRIYAREGPGSPQTNPRLNLICLSEDPAFVPTDDAAKAWLANRSTP